MDSKNNRTLLNLYVDIGNSSVKAFCNGQLTRISYRTPKWMSHLSKFLEQFPQAHRILVCSVAPQKYQTLQDTVLNQQGKTIMLLTEEIIKQYGDNIRWDKVESIGVDRMLTTIGALTYSDPPIIAITAGTAITFTVVNKDRFCIGGVIFPGISAQFSALHTHTELLPLVPIQLPKKLLGTNTQAAIQSGVIRSIAYALSSFVTLIQEQLRTPCPVYITGRSAELLLETLGNPENFIVAPALLFSGMEYIASKIAS